MSTKELPLTVVEEITLSEFEYLAVPFTIEKHFPIINDVFQDNYKDFTGKILVDSFATSGNTEYRFLSYDVTNGDVDLNSMEYVEVPRNNKLRQMSNDILRCHENLVENSILTTTQKKMLFKGMDI